MNNIELLSRETVDTWINSYIPKMREDSPDDFVLIASIMSGTEPEGWTALAEKFSVPGIKGLELNVSCPHGAPGKHMGAFIGQNADLVEEVTKAAKKGTGLPILVKLTPNVTDVVSIAQAAKKGGADGVSAINTVESLIGINVETATPMPQAYATKPGSGAAVGCVPPPVDRCVDCCGKRPCAILRYPLQDFLPSVDPLLSGHRQVRTADRLHGPVPPWSVIVGAQASRTMSGRP